MGRWTCLWMLSAGVAAALVTGCTVTFAPPALSPVPQPAITVKVELPVSPASPPSEIAVAPSVASRSSTTTPRPVATGTSIETQAELSNFVSPSGRILCAMTRSRAWCTFPDGMDRNGIPAAEQICPGGAVGSVEISPAGLTFLCGDPGPWAEPGTKTTLWADGYDVGIANGMVRLPYGWTLSTPRASCSSAENGVTCINVTTGEGFRVARAGVTRVRV